MVVVRLIIEPCCTYVHCIKMAPGNMPCSFWWRLIGVLFWLNSVYSQATYSVRLVNGPSPSEGRVEILYNGQWNTICDNYWNLEEAQVVCRQLGYSTDNVVARSFAYYGQGSGPIQQVQCSGWEYTLASCTLTSGYACGHYEDAGVRCGSDIFTTFDPFPWPTITTGAGIYNVRLVDGPSPREGRVEISYNGQWNTICDDTWNLEEAQVVCRQLGYDTDNVVAWSSAYYGQGSGPIQQVQCSGWEYTLDQCTLSSGDSICGHYEDAGVRCGTSGASPRVIGSMSFVGVSLFLLTIIAIVAVVFVCSQQKISPSAAMGMQELTTLTTNPAPQPASTTPMPAPVCVDVPV
ncbi:neurotrypsin [Strongylocentrotus purpuratus]|uniref:SRCR domain-containing protein n=1 Tax=Strongylocentrotus purpuratus TaxID=7668 RepID=A0A7M7PE46_STRPU|nr:neurotrypsin [Strongylocentrotus purpuratus]